jgi:hypothetical protein
MAAAGLGALLIPEHVPRLAGLLSHPIEGDPINRSVELVVVAGRRYSPALDAFVRIMRRHDWQRVAKTVKTDAASVGARQLSPDSERFDDIVGEFAVVYADQAQRDHRAFVKAVRDGRLKVVTEG